MRTLVYNAVVIDGTGAAPREERAVVIEDGLIVEELPGFVPYYDTAEVLIDARGGFLLPGVINHHVHGLTRGPLMIVGEPPLPDGRVRANLDRLLGQGVTTALNVDGYPTVDDAEHSSRDHAITVKVTTCHTPAHWAWVTEGPFAFGGVRERHRSWSVAEMLAAGAPAIGEAGPGVDGHWPDYTLLPLAIERLGGRATPDQARALRHAAESGDHAAVRAAADAVGIDTPPAQLIALVESTQDWQEMARTALAEAIEEATRHTAPLILHHTPGSFDFVVQGAEAVPGTVIAAHSNFQARDPDDAVMRARTIRAAGGLIDIMSGDAYSARRFHSSPEVTHRLLAEGLVDLISTDYAGGFWDPMLLVVERAAAAGATTLEAGVAMCTGNVARAIPLLAPRRGTITPGLVGDLVVTEPGRLSAVREVLIGGRPVPLPPPRW